MFYVSEWPMYSYKNISLYNTRSYIIYDAEGETLQHGYIYNKSLYLSSICGKNFLLFFFGGGSLYNRSRSEPRSILYIRLKRIDLQDLSYSSSLADTRAIVSFHFAILTRHRIFLIRSCRSIGVFLVVQIGARSLANNTHTPTSSCCAVCTLYSVLLLRMLEQKESKQVYNLHMRSLCCVYRKDRCACLQEKDESCLGAPVYSLYTIYRSYVCCWAPSILYC